MDKILYRANEYGELSLIFFDSLNEMCLCFDGTEFSFKAIGSISDMDLYQEMEYSKLIKDKANLEIMELKHSDHKVYYIKLRNEDVLEIKHTIYGYGEIVQRLFVVKKKKSLKKYSDYESYVLRSYDSAETINLIT